MSGTCQNPTCSNHITLPSDNGRRVWRRTLRRYCSDQCKLDTWVLKQAAKLLLPLGVATGWEILEGMENGNSAGKAGAEILRYKSI